MSVNHPPNPPPLQPQTPGKIRPASRAQWRSYFHDHPRYAVDKIQAYSSGKPKLYCKACFSSHLSQLKTQDQQELSAGGRAEARSNVVLTTYLWDTRKPRDNDTIGWIRGETSTILNHLRRCENQPQNVRAGAEAECDHRKGKGQQMGPPTIAIPIIQDGIPSLLPLDPPQGLHLHGNAYLPLPFVNPPTTQSGSTSSGISVRGDSRTNSPYPDSILLRQSGSRSSSMAAYSMNHNPPGEWSADRQNTFNTRLGRLTASAGLPISWIENPEFILFCQEFVHQSASVPSRKVMTRRILPNIKREFKKKAQAAIKEGSKATIQGDGWSAINDHHLNAFMMAVERKIHTLRVHDSSGESKTADKLLALLESVIKEAETDWGVRVVAVCTDASGESRKARRLLKVKFPHLVTPDCYAHQINLVVGDLFKSNSSLLPVSASADELITWLRSKSQILALLREKCRELNVSATSVIRAVITRWTAHYLAYRRLLDLRPALQSLALDDSCRPSTESVFVKGPVASKNKANAMIEIINNTAFWRCLASIKQHLEPLAIAANVTQSAFCRLDEVLLTFGALMMDYKDLRDNRGGDQVACNAVLNSLEKRWANADQDVFIAAVILNPFFKHAPFKPLSRFQPASIYNLFAILWNRFFSEQAAPLSLYKNVLDYLRETGDFMTLRVSVMTCLKLSEQQGESPDPRMLFDSFEIVGRPEEEAMPLIRLARHIFSICANSAIPPQLR